MDERENRHMHRRVHIGDGADFCLEFELGKCGQHREPLEDGGSEGIGGICWTEKCYRNPEHLKHDTETKQHDQAQYHFADPIRFRQHRARPAHETIVPSLACSDKRKIPQAEGFRQRLSGNEHRAACVLHNTRGHAAEEKPSDRAQSFGTGHD